MAVYERQTLANGIRVLTAPMSHAQSVSCIVMLAAGSRYETPETNGIAHFSEHMFFKGTENRPASRDITSALDVLVDMLRHSKFDQEEIDREKGVIIEEMNMYFDTPRDYISGLYDRLLYGDQPLGRDIIGTKETVRNARRETFLDYIDRWYRPQRLVIGIGGKIEGDL